MSTHGKEHRAPIRYGLKPDEVRKIIDHCADKGHITDGQLRKFASDFGCARKTIHDLVTQRGYQILSPSAPKKMTRERFDPRAAAEALFKKPAPSTPSSDTSSDKVTAAASAAKADKPQAEAANEAPSYLAEEETRLRKELSQKEADMLEAVSELERQLDIRSAELEAERTRVKEAIENTRQLRISTKEDRELLEEARGEITVLKLRNRDVSTQNETLRATNKKLKAELRASTDRERQLLEALSYYELLLSKH